MANTTLSAAADAARILAARNAGAKAVGDALNGGTVEIRTGTQPADPDTTATGTLLATLTLGTPAFGSASSGTATANAITADSAADATGTPTWFRAKASGGTAVIDGDVGNTASSADLKLDYTNATTADTITTGETVTVSSWTITQPA